MTPFIMGLILTGTFIVGALLWFMFVRHIRENLREGRFSEKVTLYAHFLTVLLTLFGVVFCIVSNYLYQIMESHEIYFITEVLAFFNAIVDSFN